MNTWCLHWECHARSQLSWHFAPRRPTNWQLHLIDRPLPGAPSVRPRCTNLTSKWNLPLFIDFHTGGGVCVPILLWLGIVLLPRTIEIGNSVAFLPSTPEFIFLSHRPKEVPRQEVTCARMGTFLLASSCWAHTQEKSREVLWLNNDIGVTRDFSFPPVLGKEPRAKTGFREMTSLEAEGFNWRNSHNGFGANWLGAMPVGAPLRFCLAQLGYSSPL